MTLHKLCSAFQIKVRTLVRVGSVGLKEGVDGRALKLIGQTRDT